MARTTFTGPVASTNGFEGDISGNITGNVTGNLTGNVTGDVTGNVTGNLTGNVTGTVSGGITSGATASEINLRNDESSMTQTLTGAGAVGLTTLVTNLDSTGGGFAATLATSTSPAIIKVIRMTVDNGDVTLPLTNVVGDLKTGDTLTFANAGESVVLISSGSAGPWILVAVNGATMA
jgi:hypothetical protein